MISLRLGQYLPISEIVPEISKDLIQILTA
jgi:hypothetical protein